MFERSLQDLIRGLRSHRHSSKAELDTFLDGALAEIREELKGKDMELKGEGLVKMCYVSDERSRAASFLLVVCLSKCRGRSTESCLADCYPSIDSS